MKPGLYAFACRRLVLRPIRCALFALAVLGVTLPLASGLLVLNAVEQTADRVVAAGPSLIVSRVDAGGWAPIPEAAAFAVRAIPGVAAAQPRVWGILPAQEPLTVVGDTALPDATRLAVVGPGIRTGPEGSPMALSGLSGAVEWLEVSSAFPAGVSALARDLVVVPAGVARRLLLLPEATATDIAVTSVRAEEDDALVGEIARALGYPVRVTTRAQMRGAFRSFTGERGGLWLLLALPAILALALIVGQIASGGAGARLEAGRLKLLGWTTWDVARLHLAEALIPGGLAAATGLAAAYVGVFALGGGPAAALLLGFQRVAPSLALSTEGALLALLQVGAVVLAPCAVAALIPAARLARSDPADLLEAP
ncbi:MAG: hypothetical protein HY901_29690 [Deltaproteobacteria bacterium]|nr:hypothetical protein [Deltaproteobacteria bacterium]